MVEQPGRIIQKIGKDKRVVVISTDDRWVYACLYSDYEGREISSNIQRCETLAIAESWARAMLNES